MLNAYVTYTLSNGWNGDPNCNKRQAWRVAWYDSLGPAHHHYPFARRKDAEAALKALHKAGCTMQDLKDMPLADYDELPEWKFDRVMIEALQW